MADTVKIKKSIFGGYNISYNCPHCSTALKSALDEGGNTDTCPSCGRQFVVPGAAERDRIRTEESVLNEARRLEKEQQRKEKVRQQRDREDKRAWQSEQAQRETERDPKMSVFRVIGVGSELEVFEDKLTITPKGILGVLNSGLKGTKTIPFHSITAVQHKKAGLTSGYLQFTLPGGIESRGGVFAAASDENTFMYGQRSDDAVIEQVKAYIEDRMKILRAAPASSSTGGVADQLSKLADLHRQGVLSPEEFAQAKQRLLESCLS